MRSKDAIQTNSGVTPASHTWAGDRERRCRCRVCSRQVGWLVACCAVALLQVAGWEFTCVYRPTLLGSYVPVYSAQAGLAGFDRCGEGGVGEVRNGGSSAVAVNGLYSASNPIQNMLPGLALHPLTGAAAPTLPLIGAFINCPIASPLSPLHTHTRTHR